MFNPDKDYTEADRYRQLAHEITENAHYLRPDWVKSKNFIALPIESTWYTNSDTRNLLDGLGSLNIEAFIAIALEQELSIPLFGSHEVNNSLEGLEEFVGNYGGLINHLLTTEDQKFAILSSTDDYHIVAGDKNFVQAVVGGDIKEAIADYKRHIAAESMDIYRETLETALLLYIDTIPEL